MELINRMRKKDKGFTLVEIIVVLVILAILAAFTIPTMLGFVNDAKKKALIAEAREVYVAAQATATEYGITTGFVKADLESPAVLTHTTAASKAMSSYLSQDITPVATEPAAGAAGSYWTVTMNATNTSKVDTVSYTRDGKTVLITAGGTTTVN